MSTRTEEEVDARIRAKEMDDIIPITARGIALFVGACGIVAMICVVCHDEDKNHDTAPQVYSAAQTPPVNVDK